MSDAVAEEAYNKNIEEAPLSRFHAYITTCALGGPVCDGYILGIVAIALAQMKIDLTLTPLWDGLIGSGTLIGLFFGSALFGWVSDSIGRRLMCLITPVVFIVASLANLWVEAVWAILALRLILGVAIGADYPVATALLAEFVPRKSRGTLLALLVAGWFVGYVAAFIVGFLMADGGADSWRWTLASAAVPALVFLIIRWRMPESPVWLADNGHRDKARETIQTHVGKEYELPPAENEPEKAGYAELFKGIYGKRTLFVSVFWSAQVLPLFAIFTFQPIILQGFGVENGNLGTVFISLFEIVGVLLGVWLVSSWGRRPLLLWGFALCGLSLLLIGLLHQVSLIAVFVFFILFALAISASNVLQWVYPNELFPTHIRGTAVGFCAAMSRIAAAVGTFFLPVCIAHLGQSATMMLAAGICLIGWLVSLPFAIETRGKTLAECTS